MPQKKNPDVLELLRGKTGRVLGDLVTLAVLLKGLPLAYNRDMQEDKPPVFDAARTVEISLEALAGLIPTVRFREDRLRAAAEGGYSDATAVAEYLVRKKVPFREAHRIVGELVADAIDRNVPLSGLSLDDFTKRSTAFGADVFDVLGAERCARAYVSEGGASPQSVREQIAFWKERLNH